MIQSHHHSISDVGVKGPKAARACRAPPHSSLQGITHDWRRRKLLALLTGTMQVESHVMSMQDDEERINTILENVIKDIAEAGDASQVGHCRCVHV